MAKRYSIADARANLPTIVDQVEAGESIELTRRGKPIPAIVSLRELEELRRGRSRFGEAYREGRAPAKGAHADPFARPAL
jgi:prevent-host-death family protein